MLKITFILSTFLLTTVQAYAIGGHWLRHSIPNSEQLQLIWKASTYDPITKVMELQSLGVGIPTISGATTRYCLDGETNYYVLVSSTNPCWKKARYNSGVAYADGTGGNLLNPTPTLVIEKSRTNLILYSNAIASGFAAGIWSSPNTPPLSDTAVGLTGEPNTASFVSDDSAGATEGPRTTIYKDISELDTVIRFFVQRQDELVGVPIEVPGNDYPQFYMASNNSAGRGASVILNPINGDHLDSGTGGTVSVSFVPPDDWEVILYTRDQWNSPYYAVWIKPAVGYDWPPNPITGATGRITVRNVEGYNGVTIDDIKGTSPIFTVDTPVTVSSGSIVYNSGNISDDSGLITFSASTKTANNFLSTFLGHDGSNSLINDGTTSDTISMPVATMADIGGWWDTSSNEMGICLNGTCNTAVPYDGTLLNGALDLVRTPASTVEIVNIKGYRGGNKVTYQAKAIQDTQ